MQSISAQLTTDAHTLSSGTGIISSAGNDAHELALTLTSEAQQVSQMTTSFSNALDEMKKSISEIAQNCVTEAHMAQESANSVAAVTDNMAKLEIASHEIGSILKLMNEIASKTRLLSLNATIEATSAGEAGRGFAVVAAEVKALATQSTDAAKQIQQKISAMQNQVKMAVSGVDSIRNSIDQFASISRTNSSAIEEQSATIGEINSSVQRASDSASALATGLTEMSQKSMQVLTTISNIETVVESTRKDASYTSENAVALRSISESLNSSMNKFQL